MKEGHKMAEKQAEIATEILRQLGGRRFLAMTGALFLFIQRQTEPKKIPE
jgi:hypothetical protein